MKKKKLLLGELTKFRFLKIKVKMKNVFILLWIHHFLFRFVFGVRKIDSKEKKKSKKKPRVTHRKQTEVKRKENRIRSALISSTAILKVDNGK